MRVTGSRIPEMYRPKEQHKFYTLRASFYSPLIADHCFLKGDTI